MFEHVVGTQVVVLLIPPTAGYGQGYYDDDRVRDRIAERIEHLRRERHLDRLALDRAIAEWSKMTASRPPPVAVDLASLPMPAPEPLALSGTRVPSRVVARARGRRPIRGRSGRPHDAAT